MYDEDEISDFDTFVEQWLMVRLFKSLPHKFTYEEYKQGFFKYYPEVPKDKLVELKSLALTLEFGNVEQNEDDPQFYTFMGTFVDDNENYS